MISEELISYIFKWFSLDKLFKTQVVFLQQFFLKQSAPNFPKKNSAVEIYWGNNINFGLFNF